MAKNNISRRDFLKHAAAGAAGMTTFGVIASCSGKTDAPGNELFRPGTYTSTQKNNFSTVVITCVFSSTALTDVSYEVTESSDSNYFKHLADAATDYCKRIVKANGIVNVDGISGASLSTAVIKDGVNDCIVQAMGIPAAQKDLSETSILNPQDESYDTDTTDYSAIFSPIQVGSMKLRNRIIKSSAGSDTMGRGATKMTRNTIDYYGRMADGGAALILVEEGALRSFSFTLGSPLTGKGYDVGVQEAEKVSKRVHQGGAYIGYQVGIGTPLDPPFVNEYTLNEIQDLVKDYGRIAKRLKEAGFDCIEVKGATTDGLNAFLSRRINRREDKYGPQSIENRTRLFVEIIQEIRRVCGKDLSITTLINALEENDSELGQNDKYITIEEAKAIAKQLEQAGADAIQVRVGVPGQEISCWGPDCNHAGRNRNGATGFGNRFDYSSHFEGILDGAHSGVGAFIPAAKAIKERVSVPVGCAGYIDPRTAPDRMNNAVANGELDLLYMNRPLTVDPQLPNKLQAGHRDEVAPCTRCLHCHGKPYGEAESCRVNAATQYAYTEKMPEGYGVQPAGTSKNVMIIGGGPSGLEAARIAAERGHKVSLYEEKPALGGMLPFAAAIKGPHERLEDLRTYLIRQLDLKGITVVTGKKVDADFMKAQNPDAIVVATGGKRDSKLDGPHVVAMDNVIGSEIGKRVVILGAGVQSVDLAIYLLSQGKNIQIVHGGTAEEVDKEQSYWIRKFNRSQLYAQGVKIWNGAAVKGTVKEGLSITSDGGVGKTLACDTIIECYDMLPNKALFDTLAGAGHEVYAVGDCAAPYNIQRAIHTANLTARSI